MVYYLESNNCNLDKSENYGPSSSFEFTPNLPKLGKYDDPFAELFVRFNSAPYSCHLKEDSDNYCPKTQLLDESNNCIANLDNNTSEKAYSSTIEKFEDNFIEYEKKYDKGDKIGLVDFNDDLSKILDELEPSCSNNLNATPVVSGEHLSSQLKSSDDLISFSGDRTNIIKLITSYILENIPSCFCPHYTKRIQNIDDACAALERNNIDIYTHNSIFNSLYDDELLLKLKNMCLNFDKNMPFNKQTCHEFSNEFDSKIFNSFYVVEHRRKLFSLSNELRQIVFYTELMNLYKFVVEIPELLTLGSLFANRPIYNMQLIMHMINLIAADTINIKDQKLFILCLIFKAFNYFYEITTFNIFLIPNYSFSCEKEDQHDLYFFLWGVHSNKRTVIGRRKKTAIRSYCRDMIYLRTVLVIFLFQHLIFFVYYNVNDDVIKAFYEFIEEIIVSGGCVGCAFNEYLSRISL
jgi:hypothetical protein